MRASAKLNPMLTSSLLVLPLVLAVGCKSSYYVEGFDGDWTGTAKESTGTTVPVTASFTWDDEEENLDGEASFDTIYLFVANGITSDKETADIELTSTAGFGPGAFTGLKLNEDGDKLTGKFTVNVCPNGEGELCELTGDLEMSM